MKTTKKVVEDDPNSSTKIQSFGKRGRGLVSLKTFDSCQVIFREEIALGTVNWNAINKFCSYCFKKAGKHCPFVSCSHCDFIKYCSKNCQLEDRVMHERECKILAKSYNDSDGRLFAKTNDDELDLMLMGPPLFDFSLPDNVPEHKICEYFCRYLSLNRGVREEIDFIKWKSDYRGTNVRYDFFQARQVSTRMTIRAITKIETDEAFRQMFYNLSNSQQNLGYLIANRFKFNAAFIKASISTSLTIEEILKIHNNSFHSDFGFAQFIHASLFNHSCRPNASVEVKGRYIKIASVRKISPGDEINIQYETEFESKQRRQLILMTNYGFKCECKRCEHDDPDERVQKLYLDLVANNNVQLNVRLDLIEPLIRTDHFLALRCLEILHENLIDQKIGRANSQRLISLLLDKYFLPTFGRFDSRTVYYIALDCVNDLPLNMRRTVQKKVLDRLQEIDCALGAASNSGYANFSRKI